MKYILTIQYLSTFTEVYILLFMLRNEIDRTPLYLTNNENLNTHILLVSIIIILLKALTVYVGVFKFKWRYLLVSSILSITISTILFIMFFNTVVNDHVRTLTPLLLYISIIKLILAWYYTELGKEIRSYD